MSASCKHVGAALLPALLVVAMLVGCTSRRPVADAASTPPPAWVDCAGGYVALTFDDGPDPGITPPLLDALAKEGMRATFFVIGRNVQQNPDIVRREAAEGHSVQAHTWDHPDLAKMAPAAAVNELNRGAQAVIATGLPRPTLYRPPFDSTNAALRAATTAANLTEVGYTVNTSDWKDPGVDQIVASVAGVRGGGIVEMHDHGHHQTVEAIPGIARSLRQQKLCPGAIERTSAAHPDGPTWWSFNARAVSW